jgi:hypothetical protein
VIRFHPSKHLVFLLSVVAGVAFMSLRQQALARAHLALAALQQQAAQVEAQRVAAEAALDTARQESLEQKSSRTRLSTSIARAEQELARINPDSLWAMPPENLPEWNDQSPYVWLRKATLTTLPIQPFSDEAELSSEVAGVLTLDAAARQELNAKLRRIADEYHRLEAAHAERIDQPLPDIVPDGPAVTVRVNPLPEDAARSRQEFEAALTDVLGTQRADLLIQGAARWIDSQFGQPDSQPRTISVVRHPNGTYNLSERTGSSWFSTGGPSVLDHHVPPHLRPLFSDVLPPPDPASVR